MYPGMIYWWKLAREGGGCSPVCSADRLGVRAVRWGRNDTNRDRLCSSSAGEFGVRRPLRYLAYKLELNEKQVEELARILSELKTDRAQAEVDGRRAMSAFADALDSEPFNQDLVREGGSRRVESAERQREAMLKALQRIHALLDPEQRSRLAYLIRTGTIVL